MKIESKVWSPVRLREEFQDGYSRLLLFLWCVVKSLSFFQIILLNNYFLVLIETILNFLYSCRLYPSSVMGIPTLTTGVFSEKEGDPDPNSRTSPLSVPDDLLFFDYFRLLNDHPERPLDGWFHSPLPQVCTVRILEWHVSGLPQDPLWWVFLLTP